LNQPHENFENPWIGRIGELQRKRVPFGVVIRAFEAFELLCQFGVVHRPSLSR